MVHYTALVPAVAVHMGLPALPENWSGLDRYLPFLERMREEGAVVIIKLDGLRKSRPYTGVVSGGPLGDEFFRIDERSIEECVSYIIVNYARHQWGFA